ncbi:Integrase [Theobroma cacao]|nr:Integrase [Theobroma cacao]
MVAATWSDSDTSSSDDDEEKVEKRANLCMMARDDESEVELNLKDTCSRAQLKEKEPWFMDSGYSRHMIRNEVLFAQLDKKEGGKQIRTSLKTKNIVSTFRPLELLHIDLFGPISTTSLGGKSYGFVIVDDYSRYTWVYFLAHKNDALPAFVNYYKKVENEKGLAIVSIRSDHGGEFEGDEFENFCNENGLDHNFFAPRTPQQNGVVERKNRTLKVMARTMLCENNIPKYFWAEVINIAAYILNKVSIRAMISKTP